MANQNKVTGTKNNVGQEIAEAKAAEVSTCTMTEDEHKARIERIRNAQAQGRDAEFSIMVEIASAKQRHEQELDGYANTEKAFLQWANDMFELGDTQIKQAVRILGVYASVDDKGEYTLPDKFRMYSKEKLDLIQAFPQFKTRADFDALVDALGITPATSCAVIKQLKAEAKGIETKTDEAKAETKEAKAEAKEKITREKIESTPLFIETKDSLTLCKDFITLAYTKRNEKDFGKWYEVQFKELEKSLKSIHELNK